MRVCLIGIQLYANGLSRQEKPISSFHSLVSVHTLFNDARAVKKKRVIVFFLANINPDLGANKSRLQSERSSYEAGSLELVSKSGFRLSFDFANLDRFLYSTRSFKVQTTRIDLFSLFSPASTKIQTIRIKCGKSIGKSSSF